MASSSSALPLPLSHPPNTASPPSHHLRNDSLLNMVPPPNPTLKTPSIRSRLSKLCQEGQPHLARQLFESIPRPSTVLWNTIIIGFICNNLPHEAILMYTQMKKNAATTKCDSYTYSATLKACAETKNLKVGKAVHCHMVRCLWNPSFIVYNSLLNMYSVCLSSTGNVLDDFVDVNYSKYTPVVKVFDTMRKRNVVAWNTMIALYVKTERYVRAVKKFRMMMRMGISPSPVSFVNVFPALSSIGDYKNANVLYGMLLKLGSEYVEDLFAVSSTISMFSELGYLDAARKIFDSCLDRNIEVWNTMIGGYVQNNSPEEGIRLFIQALKSDQIVLDDVTFLSVLTAVSQLQKLELANQMHAFVIKSFSSLPVIILNAIIVMYSRCNCIQASFNVFDKMPERDIVSWNTMISAFVQNGMDDEGMMLVYEMQKQGFAIDSVTVTAILSAASNLRNQKIGVQTHAYLLRHGIQFSGMESYFIDMYSKSGSIQTAKLVFEKHGSDSDQATWNAMIAGYSQNGLVEEAFSTFRLMLEQSVIPNAVTLASVIPACSSVGNVNFGKQLHGFSVRHLLDQSVYVGTALVDMYSKSGAISYAEKIFLSTPDKNSITYTTMILGYGQHGFGEKALSLFHSMVRFGIKPDAISLVAVLSACSYSGLVDEGLRLFHSMEAEYGIRPTTEHYCCVADMLGRVGRVSEAYEFVNSLGDEGNKIEIWGSLLGACRLHGKFKLGELVAQKMLEMDDGGNNAASGYHVLLSNIYADEGDWENVDRLRKEMREKGMWKEVGCSWIEIAGSVNCFVSKDQEHPERGDIYETLKVRTMDMKDSSRHVLFSSNPHDFIGV
ncbi:pentatricopeptide repeat-containing protein At3g22150, chloroplastic [Rutidosis leptorrhynchoides]|uniref:pentatricopeptide repeat-containing protein At3g22150, chloroplastic n=1 Tax=Rutidosis leptorrhynchoides TaxID=125765 RepID=UPI003A99065E